MKTLYIERSSGECRNGDWVEKLDLAEAPDRIVVGTGPGSFAGIRAALAFAQGYAIGRPKCEVLGLPSACAIAAQYFAAAGEAKGPLAVVGDARREKYWIALFDGLKLVLNVFQVEREKLPFRVPMCCPVVTPDEERIGSLLKETFGEDWYRGGIKPTADGLKAFAEADPSILKPEPLPIYLNPAVRD